jgi:Holliday junction resolvasome RuvABC endonuclease subunit
MSKLVGAEHVGLEGYAFNAKGKVFNIAENTGILKYKLWQQRIPLTVISPTEIKRLATGKGNADKELMTRQFRIDTGLNLKQELTPKSSKVINPVSDIVDSYYVCKELWYKIIDF